MWLVLYSHIYLQLVAVDISRKVCTAKTPVQITYMIILTNYVSTDNLRFIRCTDYITDYINW